MLSFTPLRQGAFSATRGSFSSHILLPALLLVLRVPLLPLLLLLLLLREERRRGRLLLLLLLLLLELLLELLLLLERPLLLELQAQDARAGD